MNVSNWQAGVSYNWSGPVAYSDTGQHPYRGNVVLADSGYYVLNATNGGCSAMDSVHVSVKPTPSVPVATSNSPLCAGDSLQFTVSNSQLGVTYNWRGPNGFVSAVQNAVRTNVTVTDSGKYIVRDTLNGCVSKPDTVDVTINPLITPIVSISSLPAIIPAGHTDTFTAHITNCPSPVYQWYLNGNKIIGAIGSTYSTSLSAGQHISVVVHCGACASPDSAVSNSLTTTGVTSPGLSKGEVRVWPNPVGESLTLSLSQGEGTARVFNAIGQLVYSNKVYRETIIDTRNYAKGVYFLEVIAEDGEKAVRKIIKE